MLDIEKINGTNVYSETTNMSSTIAVIKTKIRGFEIVKPEELEKSFKNTEVKIKLPKRSTKKAAGYDCFAPFDFTLQSGEDINIPTGIKAYMQNGEVLMVFPRSGLGFKYYTRLSNSTGIVDAKGV